MKKLIITLCFILCISSISSVGFASDLEKISGPGESNISTKSVESFEYYKYSSEVNEEGFFELLGIMRVNSITTTTIDQESGIVTNVSNSLEDLYNVEGEYIGSEILIEEYSNNLNDGKASGTKKSLKTTNPVAKFQPTVSGVTGEQYHEMDKASKIELEDYILSLTQGEGNFEVTTGEEIGFTYEDLEKIEQQMVHANKNAMVNSKYKDRNYNTTIEETDITPLSTTTRKGAYDNYFNINNLTGKFHVQVLTHSSPHRYFVRTGTTTNNELNSKAFTAFSKEIDRFEFGMEALDYLRHTEIGSWQSFVSSLALYVLGGTASATGGPIGWVGAMATASDTVALLSAYTSAKYATKARVTLSISTQQALSNAQIAMTGLRWDSDTFNTVKGY